MIHSDHAIFGVAAALFLGGCSSPDAAIDHHGTVGRALEDEILVRPHYAGFDPAGADTFAHLGVYGADSARVNDGARLLTVDGFASVSSDSYINLGTDTITGSVFSGFYVALRGVPSIADGYRINGELVAQQVDPQNAGDYVAPGEAVASQNDVAQFGLDLAQYQNILAQPSQAGYQEVEPHGVKLAFFKNYGRVTVKAGGTLIVPSGEFNFDELRLEPEARLVLAQVVDNPVVINTRYGLDLGDRSEVVAEASQVLFNHGGTSKVRVGSGAVVFNGTIVAPNAHVEVVGGLQAHVRGAFYGKSVEIHQRTVVEHSVFDYDLAEASWITYAPYASSQLLAGLLNGANVSSLADVQILTTGQMDASNVIIAGGEVLSEADAALYAMLAELGQESSDDPPTPSEGVSAGDVAVIAATNQSIQNQISAASQAIATSKTIDQKLTGKQTQ